MSTSTYTPKVGTVYDPAMVRDWTPQHIAQRPLNDPAFSDQGVGSQTYDWRKDFVLQIDKPEVVQQITKYMDRMAAHPEGRHHLRQAAAMQQHRVATGDFEPGATLPDPQGRIMIHDDPTSKQVGDFNGASGRFTFNSNLPRGEYLGTDGQWHETSLGHLLHHELGHAKDPLLTRANEPVIQALGSIPVPKDLAAAIPGYVSPPISGEIKAPGAVSGDNSGAPPLPDGATEIASSSEYVSIGKESPVIHDSNQVAHQLGLGAPRSLDHSTTRGGGAHRHEEHGHAHDAAILEAGKGLLSCTDASCAPSQAGGPGQTPRVAGERSGAQIF